MKFYPPLPAGRLWTRLALPVLAAAVVRLAAAGELTAVFAQASPGFVRARLPDGTLEAVTYTFGDGGYLAGGPTDPSIDRLNFIDLAKAVTGPLEAQHYRPVPDRDPNKTKLLVMIYWGTTRGTADGSNSLAYENLQAAGQTAASKPPPPPPASAAGHGPPASDSGAALKAGRENDLTAAMAMVALEDKQRSDADLRNAQLLGFDAELGPTAGGFGPAVERRDDLIRELEDDRYFVVLMAYDFDSLWKHQKHKLLWVTRCSVRARGTNFAAILPAMVKQASPFFGGDTHGLRRDTLPEGRVEIGPVKNLGEPKGK